MNDPIFITSAVGDHYRAEASALDTSFVKHSWPRLIVLTDFPHSEVRENVVAEETLWGGRGLKTGFAKAIPDNHYGPVIWIDADTRATGPWIGMPDLCGAQIGGHRKGRFFMGDGSDFTTLFSGVLVFSEARIARGASVAWHRYLKHHQGLHARITDEAALSWATRPYRCVGIKGATAECPLPNLWHDGRNCRSVHGRPPV